MRMYPLSWCGPANERVEYLTCESVYVLLAISKAASTEAHSAYKHFHFSSSLEITTYLYPSPSNPVSLSGSPWLGIAGPFSFRDASVLNIYACQLFISVCFSAVKLGFTLPNSGSLDTVAALPASGISGSVINDYVRSNA